MAENSKIEYRVVILVQPLLSDDIKRMLCEQFNRCGEDGWILASVFNMRTILMAAFWREAREAPHG